MGNGMLNRTLPVVVALVLLLVGSGDAFARGGLIIGFDLGGGIVSGDRGVPLLKYQCIGMGCDQDDQVRTDSGSGFGFGMRLGYNVLGYGGLEAQVFGHGNKDSGKGKSEGSAHVSMVARVCPLQFVEELKERKYDPSLYFGYGLISFNGYHQKVDGKGRGWSGDALQFGAAFDYDVGRGVSVGLDLKFIKPAYNEYIANWDDDITFEPDGSPSTWVIAPLATITFHMLDPEE